MDSPIKFWDNRHKSLNDLQSGGDRGISYGENYEFYIYRSSKILSFISSYFFAKRPLTILDAGCGKGFFSDILVRAGYIVDGIDSSEAAINFAKEKANKNQFFYQISLDRFTQKKLYDVIICIDVLFHIMDDHIWNKVIYKFIDSIKIKGIIILTDAVNEKRTTLGNYIIHRSMQEYLDIFNKNNFELKEILPYNFGVNMNKFLVFQKKDN